VSEEVLRIMGLVLCLEAAMVLAEGMVEDVAEEDAVVDVVGGMDEAMDVAEADKVEPDEPKNIDPD
jgi:hypothetical protein